MIFFGRATTSLVQEANDEAQALAELERKQFAVVVTDLMMPNVSGLELLEKLKAADPECEVILLTGEATIETAVKAMKLGAYDYLTKPCSLTEFDALVDKAVERRRLTQENVRLKEVIHRTQPRYSLVISLRAGCTGSRCSSRKLCVRGAYPAHDQRQSTTRLSSSTSAKQRRMKRRH